jgi:hypothetical protein
VRPALDASLQECRSSIPAQYEYIALAKNEKQQLLEGISAYLSKHDPQFRRRMSARQYWLFETSSKNGIICEVEIDRRRYKACSPDLWKLENKERRIEQPAIEGICVVS